VTDAVEYRSAVGSPCDQRRTLQQSLVRDDCGPQHLNGLFKDAPGIPSFRNMVCVSRISILYCVFANGGINRRVLRVRLNDLFGGYV